MNSVTPNILTAGEAAKLVGKSVPTITRAIKSGKLSAEKREPKGWNIDASELFRVFPAVTPETDQKSETLERETVGVNSVLQAELDAVRKELEQGNAERERERDQLSATIEDLRTRLDAESQERRQLTAQITDQRQQPEPQRQGLWARIMKR